MKKLLLFLLASAPVAALATGKNFSIERRGNQNDNLGYGYVIEAGNVHGEIALLANNGGGVCIATTKDSNGATIKHDIACSDEGQKILQGFSKYKEYLTDPIFKIELTEKVQELYSRTTADKTVLKFVKAHDNNFMLYTVSKDGGKTFDNCTYNDYPKEFSGLWDLSGKLPKN